MVYVAFLPDYELLQDRGHVFFIVVSSLIPYTMPQGLPGFGGRQNSGSAAYQLCGLGKLRHLPSLSLSIRKMGLITLVGLLRGLNTVIF